MEIGQTGVIGVRVNVITVLEQEHGTELDLAPIQHLLVSEGMLRNSFLKIRNRGNLLDIKKIS